jgi:hypothetical protein
LASCRETQRFSLEEFHGATSNSWFFVWGKMMMNPKKMGVSIHKWCAQKWMVYFWENPIKTWMINSGYPYDFGHPHMNCWFFRRTKVTPPMSWPRATSFGGRSVSVFRVHIGG